MGNVSAQVYVESILALQGKGPEGTKLPLAIMTSEDTHARTQALLQEHKNFGMEEGQITLIKQEKVSWEPPPSPTPPPFCPYTSACVALDSSDPVHASFSICRLSALPVPLFPSVCVSRCTAAFEPPSRAHMCPDECVVAHLPSCPCEGTREKRQAGPRAGGCNRGQMGGCLSSMLMWVLLMLRGVTHAEEWERWH